MLSRKFSLVNLLVWFNVCLIGGCVYQSNYVGSGQPTKSHEQVDPVAAAHTRIALGLKYLELGQISEAKYNLDKARDFAPRLSTVYTALAYYYQTVGEHQGVEQAYQSAIKFDAQNADAYNNYGVFLCNLKRYKEAEQAFLAAIHIINYLRVAESYENAALCALKNREYAKANLYLNQSLVYDPQRMSTLVNLATLSYATGQFQRALQYVELLDKITSSTPQILLLRVLIARQLQQPLKVKQYGSILVSQYADSSQALIYLSQRFNQSQYEQLRSEYQSYQE